MGSNEFCFSPTHSYEDLELYTNGFSEENFIGRTQFGKVYRGKIQQGSDATDAWEVTVKIWVVPKLYYCDGVLDNKRRQINEVELLEDRRMRSHPNMIQLIGYCCEGQHLGVVYDLKSLDTVHNLLIKDGFTWLQRIKVALEFARVLEFLHARESFHFPYQVRNIDAAHILLDEEYNPKFFDFSMISGGFFSNILEPEKRYVHGCFGYIDPFYATTGEWSEGCDVFAFGVVLLGLISKRVFEREEDRMSCEAFKEPFVYEWAKSEYKPKKSILGFGRSKCSLVHPNLRVEPHFYSSDGHKITKLAMRCVEYNTDKRPTMKQVVKYLLDLRIIHHLGIDKECRGHDPNPQKANLSDSEFL